MGSLSEMPLVELQVWREILHAIIIQNADDPRVVRPKEQLKLIDDEIEKRTGKPPAQVVGLKTLSLHQSFNQ